MTKDMNLLSTWIFLSGKAEPCVALISHFLKRERSSAKIALMERRKPIIYIEMIPMLNVAYHNDIREYGLFSCTFTGSLRIDGE